MNTFGNSKYKKEGRKGSRNHNRTGYHLPKGIKEKIVKTKGERRREYDFILRES